MTWAQDFLVAVQFLTCIPVPRVPFNSDALSRATKFFPVVGLLIGLGAAALQRFATPHLSRPLVAIVVLIFLVLITGALHEDGLADASDGFGGGWNREQILAILRDSRIGSFGALALVLSLLARFLLLANLPLNRFTALVVSAHVLCRWTTLPLSYFLPAARGVDRGVDRPVADESIVDEPIIDGQGARIAKRISPAELLVGTLFSIAIVFYFMRNEFWIPVVAAVVITALSGVYYSRRIGGVTGDCFGATNQLTEIAVYVCGVWNL